MKWALIAAGLLAALICIVALIGALLPRNHVASRRAGFKAPPAAVWATITDLSGFAAWRPGLKKVTVLDPVDGRLRWIEQGEHDSMTFEVVESTAPARLVVRIAQDDLPFGGSWTYELTPEGGGTRVTVTEHGEVKNVIFRFVSRFVFGHHKSLEDYLHALGKTLGEEVGVEP